MVLYGNLRTFLMPVNGRLISDYFIDCIVRPNNPDIFAFTDTNDFFYDGIQYNIFGHKPYMQYSKTDIMANDAARQIIEREITGRLGQNLKKLVIEDPYDIEANPKVKQLENIDGENFDPRSMIQQYRKIKTAYELLLEYETSNNVSYDYIIRWRFDNRAWHDLNLGSYDFNNVDIYVSGNHPPLILDWTAFGKRAAMDKCLRLYDDLGFTMADGNIYSVNCKDCKRGLYCGPKRDEACPQCQRKDTLTYGDITMASEHHLYKLFVKNGIRAANCSVGCPHRYNQ